MRRFALPAIALILFLAYPVFHHKTWQSRTEARRSAEAGYVLPSQFTRILALGHQGLVSDFLFLRTLTFFGQRLHENRRFQEEDWRYLVSSLDVITELDPYFLDPYIFAEGTLTWEAGRYEDANRLLKKGMQHLEDNWRLPFYLGFNHFYFLKNYEMGAEYLMQASRIEGSPSFLMPLAARLTYYGGQSKTGVLFLKGMLAESEDPRLRTLLEKRLVALERAAFLEEKIEIFKRDLNRGPEKIEELVEKGYIENLPEDPYGGNWILLDSGRVFSTSRFAERAEKDFE